MKFWNVSSVRKGLLAGIRGSYRRFKTATKLRYLKFILFKNYEFDPVYMYELLILKLTAMGVYLARWGDEVDESRRPKIRQIWQTRKHLKNYLNSEEIVEELRQQRFTDKYGFPYESEMFIDDNRLEFVLKAPVLLSREDEGQLSRYYYENPNWEYEYGVGELRKAFAIMAEFGGGWWA